MFYSTTLVSDLSRSELHFKWLCPPLIVFFLNYFSTGKDDTRITADGIDCTFLREPDKIMKFFTPQNSTSSLAELLYGFFEFYSEFDFNSKGISLYTGSSWGKPDSGPMYLQNPLERHLNVSRNVSREEVVRFKSKSKEFLCTGKGLDYSRNA